METGPNISEFIHKMEDIRFFDNNRVYNFCFIINSTFFGDVIIINFDIIIIIGTVNNININNLNGIRNSG